MKKSVDFENKISRIEEIIEILDVGELPLEELIKCYEEGIKLTNETKEFLSKAELKIIDIANNKEIQ
ncbi:exodeoxyribonuclease VII small subunit [Candidatus Kapaibacterium sp.]